VLQELPPTVDDEGVPHFAFAMARIAAESPQAAEERIGEFAVVVMATSRVYTRRMPEEEYSVWKRIVEQIPQDERLALLKYNEAHLLALNRNMQ
jgi:hypothetical protein